MNSFTLNIFTPFNHYYSDEVEYLQVCSEKYMLGILPNHAPLVSTVVIGEIVIQKNGKKESYATSGGIIKVGDNKVELLLQSIESMDEIDLDRAMAAKERALKRLANPDLETMKITASKLALARAENRINLKNARK